MPDTICPVCGRSDYYQGKPTISSLPISLCCNGTCSQGCAQVKANVEALGAVHDLVKANTAAFIALHDLIKTLAFPRQVEGEKFPANLRDRTPYYV